MGHVRRKVEVLRTRIKLLCDAAMGYARIHVSALYNPRILTFRYSKKSQSKVGDMVIFNKISIYSFNQKTPIVREPHQCDVETRFNMQCHILLVFPRIVAVVTFSKEFVTQEKIIR